MPPLFHSFRRFWPLFLLAVSSASAVVYAEVEIVEHPESKLEVEITSEVEFAITAVGEGELSYQWRLNGVNIKGATGPIYRIARVTPRDAGIYTVAVGDEDGFITSAQAQLSLLLPGIGQVNNSIFQGRYSLEIPEGILRAENSEAVFEEGEPWHAGKRGGKSIWFQWTAPLTGGEGIMTLTTEGSAFDTLLGAYRGNALGSLEEVAASDDAYDGFLTSVVQFNTSPGQTYYFAVDGFAGAIGEAVVSWKFQPTPDLLPHVLFSSTNRTAAPGEKVEFQFETDRGQGEWLRNGEPLQEQGQYLVIEAASEADVGSYAVRVRTAEGREVVTQPRRLQLHIRDDGTFDPGSSTYNKLQDAAERALASEPKSEELPLITLASSGPARGYSSTQIFSTYGSVKEPDEPNHCGEAGGASEWYAYQAPQDGMLQINTDGSNFDTVLAVYTGPGTDFASLVPKACNNEPGNGGDRVMFPVQQDEICWIAVDGVGGATGTVKLNMNLGDPVEILTHPASQAVAAGSSVTLSVEATGSPELEYTWYRNGQPVSGATASDYAISSVSEADAGDYTVEVSNLINSVTSSAATLTVNTPPSITSQPASQTVNEGDPVSFTVAASGTAPFAYQWYRGEDELAGETHATFEIAAASEVDAGDYAVVVANAAGTATSSTATLTVNTPPSITSQPASQTVNEGDAVSFTVAATGTAPLAYQWYRGGDELAGETDAMLEIAAASEADAGDYSVAVTNAAGTASSAAATLTVNTPPAITSQPLDRTVPPGGEGTLSVAATGTPEPSYQWFFNDEELVGMTEAVLSLPGFQSTHEGQYKVQVNNSLGTVTSETVRLALDWPPRIERFLLNEDGFQLHFVGPAQKSYDVQASDNLSDWTSLRSHLSETGFLEFTDDAAGGIPFRFYRVVETQE